MAVAGQGPLGQQLAAAHRPRAPPASRGADPVRGQRRAGGDVGAGRGPRPPGRRRPDPSPNSSTTASARLAGVGDAAEDDHEPLALHRAQRVHARGRGRTRRTSSKRSVSVRRAGTVPSTTATSPRAAPAQRAGPGEQRPRRPRRAAPRRRPAPRAGRPRRRGPRRPGRRPRRWRTRPRGRSAAPRRAPRGRRRGRARSSMLLSTTSIESRTRSTVCWRLMTPARARGAAPKTDGGQGAAARGPVAVAGGTSRRSRGCRPARSCPTQERSSALSSRNHGRSVSMRAMAAVLRAPVDALQRLVARARGAGERLGRDTNRPLVDRRLEAAESREYPV